MNYISVCSGIEAATVAWHPLGWQPVAFAEIEKFPSAVLAHHYPHVPNFGDMSKFKDWPDVRADVLVGGTPCQSFSVAGLRKGMADPRGNLALTYLAIADRYRPEWLLWENVPGVLSSSGGRDFGAFLGGMVELGYGFAYRVLDAQYVRVDGFGRAVPQRRRRVFVVGNSRNWRRAAAVLFERESLSWDSAPRRKAGQGFAADIAPSIVSSGRGVERAGDTRGQDPVVAVPAISHCLNAGGMGRIDYETETMIAHPAGYSASGDGFWRDGVGPLRARPQDSHENIIAIQERAISENADAGPDGIGVRADGAAYTLEARTVPQAVAFDMRGREGGAQFEGPHETANIRAASGGSSRSYVQIGADSRYASHDETDTTSALLALREAIGAEAFAEWGLGILDTLRSSEILRPDLHGCGIRSAPDEAGRGLDDRTLPRPEASQAGTLRDVRDAGRQRRAPRGRRLPEQLTRQLETSLSKLSLEGAPANEVLLCLRRSSEGIGVLQQALHPVQRGTTWAVRRLTPVECEKLQGFAPGYTNVPWRGKDTAPDGPRYKALGNSMAVNAMRWIGQRIQTVSDITKDNIARDAA